MSDEVYGVIEVGKEYEGKVYWSMLADLQTFFDHQKSLYAFRMLTGLNVSNWLTNEVNNALSKKVELEPLIDQRGLPEDLSKGFRKIYGHEDHHLSLKKFERDGSWITLEELEKMDRNEEINVNWSELMDAAGFGTSQDNPMFKAWNKFFSVEKVDGDGNIVDRDAMSELENSEANRIIDEGESVEKDGNIYRPRPKSRDDFIDSRFDFMLDFLKKFRDEKDFLGEKPRFRIIFIVAH